MIHELAPRASLRDWVDSYWISEAGVGTACVLPDNCADALFDLDTAEGFAVGTMTSPLMLAGMAAPAYFGIRFKPGKARSFFGVPLPLVTDQRIPLPDLGNRSSLARQLAEESSIEARVQVAEKALERLLTAAQTPDRRIEAAVARLTADNESIDQVAGAIGMTRQHLRRRFVEEVGIPPKTFARVARFRRLLRAVQAGTRPSWAALAIDHGYFDQSHLIAEFRELAGTSPVPFFLSR